MSVSEREQDSGSGKITQLLARMGDGDQDAPEILLDIVYAELKQMAARFMKREHAGHTLQSTALVHEAWIKMLGSNQDKAWHNRAHFFATVSLAMRHILVDSAKARQREKRGGNNLRFEFDDNDHATFEDKQLIALDEALQQLHQIDPVKSKLVTMRYFGGFTIAQAAEHLGISTATTERYWTFARAWLRANIEL